MALRVQLIDSNKVISSREQQPHFIEIRIFGFTLLNLPELLG